MNASIPQVHSSIAKQWSNPWVRLTAIAVAYVGAVALGLRLVTQPEGISVVWPASGLALAALLLTPRRDWPALIAFFFLVNLLANLIFDAPVWVSLGYALVNSVEPALCGWVMRRMVNGPLEFDRVPSAMALIVAAAFINGVTAVFGTLIPVLAFGASFRDTWLSWWILDGCSMLVLTPLILTWMMDESPIVQPLSAERRLETVVWLGIVSTASLFLFGMRDLDIYLEPRPYMLMPFLAWIALRLSPRASSTAMLMLAVTALTSTAWGTGLHPLGGETLRESMISVQGFVSVASITTTLLMASFKEQMLTERLLKQSGNRFRAMIENSVDAITLIGADGAILYESPTAERLSGYTAEERLGQNGFSNLHPDDAPTIMETFKRLLAHPGLTESLEFRSLRKGGVMWWTEISATNCLHIPEVQAIVVNFRDVTERRKAETERSRLMAELERKNKDLESLIYVASHDLRSPLVNNQGFGRNLQKYLGQTNDLLQSSDTLDDFRTAFNPLLENKIPSALQFIEAASTKMDILIDGLLRVSRIGRAVLQKRLVDMDLLLQEIVKSMAFQLDKAGAHVEVVSPLAGCYVDPNQINQVFSNLIDNAIKYRNPNVPLTITISSQVQDRYALYTVADTGMGIAAENQDKIWELFYRLEGEAAIPGEGLGLTISRRIVERHGGRIWVESEPGVGSRFMVELPLKA